MGTLMKRLLIRCFYVFAHLLANLILLVMVKLTIAEEVIPFFNPESSRPSFSLHPPLMQIPFAKPTRTGIIIR